MDFSSLLSNFILGFEEQLTNSHFKYCDDCADTQQWLHLFFLNQKKPWLCKYVSMQVCKVCKLTWSKVSNFLDTRKQINKEDLYMESRIGYVWNNNKIESRNSMDEALA